MYVFSHLHKAAGTTVNHVLRRTFGPRHLDVSSAHGHKYTELDLRSDLSKFIEPQSIAGHGLRPYIDYGDLEHRMEWYTIIRNPLDRCISHYQHQVQKMSNKKPFLEWIQNRLHRNWMVYFYGGSDSLQRAIDSIEEKQIRVLDIADGLQSGMQTLFSGQLDWTEAVRNPAKDNKISDNIRSNEDLMAELLAANQLDVKLFHYMKRLDTVPFPSPIPVFPLPGVINTQISFVYRNLVYKPLKKVG